MSLAAECLTDVVRAVGVGGSALDVQDVGSFVVSAAASGLAVVELSPL